ncbi:hypothetical protein FO519_001208 [Halicephalobus sp. NKZ332]|nr:hypothetical protein FO519_001208 [Halicephalobus sp. NKZ332]
MTNTLIHWQDYTIFGFSLLLSIGTGIYHAIRSHYLIKRGGEDVTTAKEEYMMGGRKLPRLPVALSLLTTFLSGILMLAIPAEMFQRGAHIWLNMIIGVASFLLAAVFFLPVFYKMKMNCLHEYFIHRYNSKLLRQTFSVISLFSTVFYMAVVIYAPSVALSNVLNINKWILILGFGLTTTGYTTIGGLKAVVWTDSLQAILMYAGVVAVIVKGLTHERVGGLGRVFEIASDTGRIEDAFRFNPTIAQYNSFWIDIIGGTISWLSNFGVNQLSVQRYSSLPSLEHGQSIIYYLLVPFTILCSIVCFVGFIALAYFYNCNPLETGEINDQDQLIMKFALEVLSSTPGLFGLYIACIMAATLSTLSSGINSAAAALYEDFVQYKIRKVSDSTETMINKLLVLGIGILSTLLAFCAEPLRGTLAVCMGITRALGGPLLGIFAFAMFCPRAGVKSTFISFLLSIAIMCVIYVFNYIENPYEKLLMPTNTTVEGCGHSHFTISKIPDYDAHFGRPGTTFMGRISIYAYPIVGFALMFIIGVPLTYLFNEKPMENIEHLTFKEMTNTLIHWQDYAIFGFSLLLSIGTGIYHAIRSHYLIKQGGEDVTTAKEEYMMGGRKLSRLPVALSLLTTFLSGILMLAIPAEMFQRGGHIWLHTVTGAIALVLAAVFFLPVFYKMKMNCLHEYFIHRYNSKLLRQTFSLISLFSIVFYMAVVIYAPSVALSNVLNINKWILILIFGLTTTGYTTLGGLKAVVWTDSLQAILMYAGVIAVIMKGLTHERVGGLGRVFDIAWDTGRIGDIFQMNPTIAQYNSFWINIIGNTISWLSHFGASQLSVQRYSSLPSLEHGQSIIYYLLVPFIILCSIVCFVGFIALAYFYNCNPLETGEIGNQDQLIMEFALEVLNSTPGLFGLYIACIMAATLSTLSSGINSAAAALYEDFVQYKIRKVSDSTETMINKLLVLGIGILSTLLAFCAEPLRGTLAVCMGITRALGGPLLGIFAFAMFCPRAGVKSTFISFLLSIAIMCVIYVFNYIENPYEELLMPTNTTVEGCGHSHFTISKIPDYDAHFGKPGTTFMGRISIYAYPIVGFALMFIIGVPLTYFFNEKSMENIEHLTFKGRNLPMPKNRNLPNLKNEIISKM